VIWNESEVGKLGAGKKSIPPLSETPLMKPELQAKFLQHLNKKNQDEGFTLIELLVVIIIIGILAAIALPNFLNQSAKAKQSEAKQNIGVVNRTQTAYRTENAGFATGFDVLSIGTLTGGATASTSNYSYSIAGGVDTATVLGAALDTSLKAYSGANTRFVNTSSESVISSVACEANAPGTGAATAPNATSTAAPTCPANYKTLGK